MICFWITCAFLFKQKKTYKTCYFDSLTVTFLNSFSFVLWSTCKYTLPSNILIIMKILPVLLEHPVTLSQGSHEHFSLQNSPYNPLGHSSSQFSPKVPGVHACYEIWLHIIRFILTTNYTIFELKIQVSKSLPVQVFPASL